MTILTRRDFVKLATHALLAASGLLGVGALLRYLGLSPQLSMPTEIDLGPAANYPLGSRTLLPDIPAMLSHTEAGYTALSLACPHLGCTLGQKMEDFACPCHGSHFSADGTVQRGPAGESLASFRIEQTAEGHLILFRA